MIKLKVTKEAKRKAKTALELRESLPPSKQFGLDKQQARQFGINSGVERAKQIVNSNYINKKEDVEAICRFKRWLPQKRSVRVQGAIDLWGGDKFINKACKTLKR